MSEPVVYVLLFLALVAALVLPWFLPDETEHPPPRDR